jgi:hypothetical protein
MTIIYLIHLLRRRPKPGHQHIKGNTVCEDVILQNHHCWKTDIQADPTEKG